MNPLERLARAKDLLEANEPGRALKLLAGAFPAGFASEREFLAGEALREQGFFDDSASRYQEALRRLKNAGGERDLAFYSHLGLARCWRSLGLTRSARAEAEKAGSLARGLGATQAEELSLERAMIERAEGNYPLAISLLEKLLKLYKSRGDHSAAGFALWALAGARRFSGDLASSETAYLASRAACRKSRDDSGEAYALLGLGGVCRIRGRLAQALGYYSSALAAVDGTGDYFARAYAQCGLANVLRRLGRLEKARAHYQKARALYSALGDRVDGAFVDWGLGQIALQQGSLEQAERHFKAALDPFLSHGETRGAVLSETALASVLHARGKTTQAEALFERALKRARSAKIHAHLEIYT